MLEELTTAWGITWFDYQEEVLQAVETQDPATARICLYYRTGAGKTYTALAVMHQLGITSEAGLVVIAPPVTHEQWHAHAAKIGLTITTMSHAKYRQKDVRFKRTQPVIVDEFHMLGKHTGPGFTKLDRQAQGMKAPLLILSATPNYNDAERVYCVQHVLDPEACRGGYIEWIVKNCRTTPSRFSITPDVLGFLDGESAAVHLANMPHVYYVEDPHKEFPIEDILMSATASFIPEEFTELGYDERTQRLLASQMEERHAIKKYQLLRRTPTGNALRELVKNHLKALLLRNEKEHPQELNKVMIFCQSSEVAVAAYYALFAVTTNRTAFIVTGATKDKAATARAFINSDRDSFLVGTASMATGFDGVDKVCDLLIILDDTDDESLRRQVIGRILPRGTDQDASRKKVIRLLPEIH